MAVARALLLIAVLLCLPAAARAQSPWGPELDLGGEFSDIAVSGNTVHWVQGFGAISYRRSTDNGATWSAPVQIATGRIHLTDVLAADGQDVWVLYLRDTVNFNDGCCPRTAGNIYMRRSQDGGLTWQPQVQLTTTRRAFRISMAVLGARVHVAWQEHRPGDNTWDIFALRSPDRGSTWEPRALLAAGQTGAGNVGAQRPRIAARGSGVHVAWLEKGVGQSAFNPGLEVYNVRYRRSLDNGTNWEPVVELSPGNAHSLRPNVATVASGVVVVSWDDDRPDGLFALNPFSRRSADGGATWEPEVRISTVKGDHGTLKSSDTLLFHSWHTAAPPNIALSVSLDEGQTWEPTQWVNSPAPGDRSTPLLAVSPNYLHVTWLDGRTGGSRSWYRRSAPFPCYPDCDGSSGLGVNDFLCFLNRFAAGDPSADCDGSSALGVNDLLCFLQQFASGCP